MSFFLCILFSKCHLQYIQTTTKTTTTRKQNVKITLYGISEHSISEKMRIITVPRVISLISRSESPSFRYCNAFFLPYLALMVAAFRALRLGRLRAPALDVADGSVKVWQERPRLVLQREVGIAVKVVVDEAIADRPCPSLFTWPLIVYRKVEHRFQHSYWALKPFGPRENKMESELELSGPKWSWLVSEPFWLLYHLILHLFIFINLLCFLASLFGKYLIIIFVNMFLE